MRVSQGWSGEVQSGRWAKFSVSCDEVDLHRMLVEGAVLKDDSVEHSNELLRCLPTSLVFQLLAAEAEKCVLAKLTTAYGMPKEEGTAKIAALHMTQVGLLAKVGKAKAEAEA